ncbi:thermonuclease family protein [Corticibacter populi]|uniref:Thermonuclease family protein n=1 Tax=Corticibacter populi TaxID=1550736 RepID=A0A3M6QYW2_9BURK|nr:thermonuclease family protein [Corticibacter populi]RMX08083.1 thermonuclease family protein [Corticibacter populi]RZS35331.1 endonuclease YncB(thermonuclease family) [Corticibacter populi]
MRFSVPSHQRASTTSQLPRRHCGRATAFLLFIATLLFGCGHAPAQGQAGNQSCTISRVPDGDSLEARCQGRGQPTLQRLRLRSIDAPELRQRHGQTARQALLRLCLGQRIELPLRPPRDRYGRVLADVRCQQTDAGEHMVGAGLAWYYRATADDYPRLVRLEQQARRSGKGLWGDANPTPPWQWRQSRQR